MSKTWFDDIVVASSYIGPISPMIEPVTDDEIRRSDFNQDGEVGFLDFLDFVAHFGSRQSDPGFNGSFDLNTDGAIDFQDFLSFASVFGRRIAS